ncbi:MAG: SAM-dependent methyltransferase, partial [Defluviitaleaceae bacterium]|nr:SAM-dependent methyltransferase [Defluviitaleaceae bacterium]
MAKKAKLTKKQLQKLKAKEQAATKPSHNRQKQYILTEGTPIPPLVDMGVFTKEGKVAAPMQHKYRQINRFLEMIDDTLDDDVKSLSVVDFGCGKSYLTFVVYYFLTEIKGIDTKMVGLDLKTDVIAHCQEVADKYGYHNLKFMCGDIGDFAAKQQAVASDIPKMVISLHA